MPTLPLHQSAPPWSTSNYWQNRFTSHDTPWELGHPSSVVCEALDELEILGVAVRQHTAMSPGCGRGSDVLELLQRGASVTAIDWSDIAVNDLRKRAEEHKWQERLTVLSGDFFSFPPQLTDLVVEHTFFCAIDPSRRSEYVSRVSTWIKPGGFLVGNFFVLPEEEARTLRNLSLNGEAGGPPFVATTNELKSLFAPHFITRRLHPATRPEPTRKPGMEWVGIFERR